jgi:hypothetical protein
MTQFVPIGMNIKFKLVLLIYVIISMLFCFEKVHCVIKCHCILLLVLPVTSTNNIQLTGTIINIISIRVYNAECNCTLK